MEIVPGFPPNINAITEKFQITYDTVFAYGDKIYNPSEQAIHQDLLVHEQTHQKQQEAYGVEQWWAMYIDNPAFRLIQEVEAYRAQYQYIQTVLNRKGRLGALNKLAEQLSSPLYGSITSKKEAKELIDV